MKLANSLLLPAICWSARLAAAATAHVYTHDPQSQPRSESPSTTLDPVAARLVLAQRIGVEDYHSSDLTRKEVIDAINDYGVRTPLFAQQQQSRPKKAFIMVEDLHVSPDSISSLKPYTSFKVDPAPRDVSTRGLFVDLVKQADPTTFSKTSDSSLYVSLWEGKKYATSGDMFYVARTAADFETLFTRLAKTNEWSITAFVMPSTPADAIKPADFMSDQEGERRHWGTYEMPNSVSPLKKRQTKEEPLTETQGFHPVQSFTAPVSVLDANNTKPLRGILPGCFSSQSACESQTRNCTGHGSCMRKYHDGTASKDGSGIDCFVCACKATLSADGKITTNWGGPGCQKKDISVQFWLIVLFTVGLIFLIGFAVGTIWEMGQAELPSVLGANVSGPSARK